MVTLLQPMRLRILERAHEPVSAATIAAEIGLTRQKVNYHVRALAKCKFLRRAGRHRKRNMIEQRYVASARSYVLSPDVLGRLQADHRHIDDVVSVSRLLALGSRMCAELGQVSAAAAAADKRVATLSIATDVRFTSAKQRAAFATALRDAVTDVVSQFSSPFVGDGTTPARGKPFRLVVGSYPIPAHADLEPKDQS
jgi:hypothetical protein